jgi:nucleotide-binding universal stress UspA family protein
MYAHILVSTDGSDIARKGVEHGLALAKALNAKVTAVTVTEPLAAGLAVGRGGWIPPQEMRDNFNSAREDFVNDILADIRAMAGKIGISLDFLHISDSHPSTAIVETAKSRGCDLIVMASHGRSGLTKLFLGSQTSAVLADGSVPVLIVRG